MAVLRPDRSISPASGNVARVRNRFRREAENQEANQGNQSDRIGYRNAWAH
ncbi:hypothetical protein [Nioella nitratireducens]|uniref:hypothetical protein n=1 Tax=Nioella nitratireducens TaxID=1287720 RepID=UPI001314CAD2|nr:hypothetical protein [Nioella nitratireducens]